MRDVFLSTASHELKTPITSLRLQLQMSRKKVKPEANRAPPPGQLANMLDSSLRQTDRLTGLVEDLLDVSRIQAGGKFDMNLEEVPVAKMIESVVQRYRFQLEAAGCSAELALEPELTGRWDRTRVEQVLTNLLANAEVRPGESDLGFSTCLF
jgi:signal transduction histidine kinase